MSHNQYKMDEFAFPESEKTEGEDTQPALKKKEKSMSGQSFQILRNEFLMNMQKFLTHIQRTIQQIEGKSICYSAPLSCCLSCLS